MAQGGLQFDCYSQQITQRCRLKYSTSPATCGLHARAWHAFSSSKLTSRSCSFRGHGFHRRHEQSTRRHDRHTTGSVLCQAGSDKMVIAVTGQSEISALLSRIHEDCANTNARIGALQERQVWLVAGSSLGCQLKAIQYVY